MVVFLLAVDEGGYFADTRRWAGLALLAATGLRVAWLGRPHPTRLGVATVSLLAVLALWTLLSSTWGIAGTAAGFEAERTLFYAIALSALLVLCDGGWAGLLTGVLAGIAAVCVVALALAAGGFVERDPFEGTLLHEPVGYANALGIVAAMGVLLGAGKALEPGPRHMRALAASAAVVAGVALVLTESRGAWLALACGAGVLVALRAPRPFAWAVPLGLAATAALAAPFASYGHRTSYWRAALDDAQDAPLLGSGAGSFDDYWRAHGTLPVNVRDAHSLYLEILAELGPIGLAFLVTALVLPLVALWRVRAWAPAATPAAAYLAWLVHAGIDWDWEVPVTTLVALACAAVLLGATPLRGTRAPATAGALDDAPRPECRAASDATPR